MNSTSPPIELCIGSNVFAFWSEIDLGFSFDSYATCDLTAPFEPDRKEFRRTFKPFSFQDMEVKRGGKPLFTGTLVGIDPEVLHDKASVRVSGYSRPGVLVDCSYHAATAGRVSGGEIVATSPIEREFRGMTLRDIAHAVTEPFGIDVDFRGPNGAKFDKVKIEYDGKVHAFLEDLAQQRGFVMSNTPEGALLFWQSIEPTPQPSAVALLSGQASRGPELRARLKSGERPMVSVRPVFDAQSYASELHCRTTAKSRRSSGGPKSASQCAVRNPWLSKFRPRGITFGDVDRADLPEIARAELGRVIAGAASWEVTLPTWTDPQGALWEPNTLIELDAPDAMIYRATTLMVRRVGLHVDGDGEHAKLSLVLPGVFATGELPERLPWDD
jgi:prophage tail gpP-like protein